MITFKTSINMYTNIDMLKLTKNALKVSETQEKGQRITGKFIKRFQTPDFLALSSLRQVSLVMLAGECWIRLGGGLY